MPYLDPLSECDWENHPYETDIEVSTNGRVLSYKSGKRHELKPSDNGRGYLTVSVGARNPRYIHDLVAETYIPNPNGYSEVNHIDGNKQNNCVSNLEWCTRSDNLRHAREMGLWNLQKPIRIVETGEVFKSQTECAKHIDGSSAGIHDCRSGKCETHRGYHFEFQDGNGEWYSVERKEPRSIEKRVKVVETGITYDSITKCAMAINGTVPGIVSCKSGRQETHRGYHFDFLEDEEECLDEY